MEEKTNPRFMELGFNLIKLKKSFVCIARKPSTLYIAHFVQHMHKNSLKMFIDEFRTGDRFRSFLSF